MAVLTMHDSWRVHGVHMSDEDEIEIQSSNERYIAAIQRVGTNDEVIKLGEIGGNALGWGRFKNLDQTNFIEIKKSIGGAIITRILPGEVARFRIDPADTAPAAKANGSPILLEYSITEN